MVDSTTARSRTAPLVTAVVLGAIAVALFVVLLAVIRPDRTHHTTARGLTGTEQQAVDAAKQIVTNTLTYSRASFDKDYARTLAGATGSLASDLGKLKSQVLSQMNAGKFDLQGQVTAAAFEQSDGTNYLVLVSAQGFKLPDGGQRTLQSAPRFELTMVRTGGRWLANNLTYVGLI
jgi:hypothetical protein